MLPDSHENARHATVGESGTGKSTSVKKWLARQLERGQRVVVFDPEDEFSQLGKKREGLVVLGPLTQRCTSEELEQDPQRWLGVEQLALAVVPSEDEDECAEDCATFVKLLEAYGDCLAGFDEVGHFAFKNDQARLAQKALERVATRGRKWGVPCFFVSQRLVHLTPTMRSQLSALEVFCQSEPDDLRALEDRTERHSPGLAEKVPALDPGESVLWCNPLATRAFKKEKQQ